VFRALEHRRKDSASMREVFAEHEESEDDVGKLQRPVSGLAIVPSQL
jgi:hypothetical protein